MIYHDILTCYRSPMPEMVTFWEDRRTALRSSPPRPRTRPRRCRTPSRRIPRSPVHPAATASRCSCERGPVDSVDGNHGNLLGICWEFALNIVRNAQALTMMFDDLMTWWLDPWDSLRKGESAGHGVVSGLVVVFFVRGLQATSGWSSPWDLLPWPLISSRPTFPRRGRWKAGNREPIAANRPLYFDVLLWIFMVLAQLKMLKSLRCRFKICAWSWSLRAVVEASGVVIWCLMCNFDLSKEWPSFRLEWRSFRLDKEQLEALVAGCYNNLSILPCPLARIRGSMLSSKHWNSAPFSLF